MVPDAIYLQTFNLSAGMIIVGEGLVEKDPERLLVGGESRYNVTIRGITTSMLGSKLHLVRTDTGTDKERVPTSSKTREVLADMFRDWVHESPLSKCDAGADTCPDWELAYELADRTMTALRQIRG